MDIIHITILHAHESTISMIFEGNEKNLIIDNI